MRKFALYYGVTRKGEKKILAFGNRGDIHTFKAKCMKDFADKKMCREYKAFVLATDFGLKNVYKPTHPEAAKLAKDAQEAAAKADQLVADKALIDAKKAAEDKKKADAKAEKEAKAALEVEEKAAEERLKAEKEIEDKRVKSESDKATEKAKKEEK